MFKIISLPDNKGSVYSPFIIAALILITFGVSAHFVETRTLREASISAAGRTEKAELDLEEQRAEARMMAFHSVRSILHTAGNKTFAELEEEVAEDMDARVRGIFGVSSISGNYSFSLTDLSGGRILLVSVEAPRACLNRSEVVVCADLSVEEVIDRRWIP